MFVLDLKKLCTIEADMTNKTRADIERISILGGKYEIFEYDIILLFGGPELKAQIRWKDRVCSLLLI